ncbi:MAG TPA: hypothetical protein VKZ60_02015 [Chloroflexota bacterium]|jgi:predicted metal-dependent enzyme (double-stranded beta helix superfamily)|nr:hypothetical protein [Chloroflexota bacterium]
MATAPIEVGTQGAHFARYIAAMRALWAEDPASAAAGAPAFVARARALLEELLRETPPDEPWAAGLLADRVSARELYRDPDHGFIQMGHFHGPATPGAQMGGVPHDHGPLWVLYGVYRGGIEITRYRRTDDGRDPARATLEQVEVATITPGTVQPYLAGEVHRTRQLSPDGSVVLRFLSGDLERVARYRYDLATGQRTRL